MYAGFSQNPIDRILQEISKNNPAIKSNAAYWSAQKAHYGTGLTPYDPQIEYDYLFGSPAGAGNQKDFSVTQRLDFPTAYGRRKKLSVQQSSQADYQQQVFRQDILLEAKLIALELPVRTSCPETHTVDPAGHFVSVSSCLTNLLPSSRGLPKSAAVSRSLMA